MILLHADDPGGANFIAPLSERLLKEGIASRFQIAPGLTEYAADRGMKCLTHDRMSGTGRTLAGVKLLLVGSSEDPDCVAHELVDAARAAGIPSLGVVDMKVNADRRFRGRGNDPLGHAPDWLAVTDAAAALAYSSLGYPRDRLLVVGHPHYDQVRAQSRKFEAQDRAHLHKSAYPSAPQGRPVWLFLAEGVDQLNPSVSFRGPDYTLHGRGKNDFRSVIVLEELLDAAAALSPVPWIVLRLHPKNRAEDFIDLVPELGMVSQGGDPLPLVWAADFVFGMTTMLLLETYLLGRPHLSILPRCSERAWLPTIEDGLTGSVCSRDELKRILASGCAGFAAGEDRLPSGAVENLLGFIKQTGRT